MNCSRERANHPAPPPVCCNRGRADAPSPKTHPSSHTSPVDSVQIPRRIPLSFHFFEISLLGRRAKKKSDTLNTRTSWLIPFLLPLVRGANSPIRGRRFSRQSQPSTAFWKGWKGGKRSDRSFRYPFLGNRQGDYDRFRDFHSVSLSLFKRSWFARPKPKRGIRYQQWWEELTRERGRGEAFFPSYSLRKQPSTPIEEGGRLPFPSPTVAAFYGEPIMNFFPFLSFLLSGI